MSYNITFEKTEPIVKKKRKLSQTKFIKYIITLIYFYY